LIFTLLALSGNFNILLPAMGAIPSSLPSWAALSSLFTALFTHAGFFHLLSNMFFLWMFGDNVEERMGSRLYIYFYFTCGFASLLGQMLSDSSSAVPIVGSSGAISGVIGAYFYLFPHVTVKTLVLGTLVDLPAWVCIGLWFFLQLISSLGSAAKPVAGVAGWVHVAGFVVGMLIAKFIVSVGIVERGTLVMGA
jgi:membrane associated rhomboid family serine protease